MGALAKTSLVPGPGTLNLKLGEGNANDSQSIRCKIQLINEKWNQYNEWSLYGLYQSLELQGREKESKEIYNQRDKAWKASDITIKASHL
mgnify:CR=1 FL=1